ncbi:MAG: 4-demethylwyosine synthase TYW1 [Candidatus Woesearchaeota archaeon]
MEEKTGSEREERFVRQQYGQVGKHAVCKVCSWTKRAIRGEGHCYKHYFYGISTGKCLEMSPILICNQRCKHCWRDQSLFAKEMEDVDDPEEIIEGCIKARRQLLIGFKGNENVDQEKVEEFLIPKQAAISLTGEPCLYPKLPELIEKFYEKSFDSVFLVTNGTVPEMVKRVVELNRPPTNIYLSVEAWDKDNYKEFCKPLEEGQWEKIQETMNILRESGQTTVLRITCVKGFNMDDSNKFKWVLEKMRPTHVECKGYMFVGYSRKRLQQENMPLHEEVKEFAERLAEISGYKLKGEQEESRVVLLSRE